MKCSPIFILLIFLASVFTIQAQKKRVLPNKKNDPTTLSVASQNSATVVNERLAVLRMQPGFNAATIRRLRNGRIVTVTSTKQADGVTFYRIVLTSKQYGWVQADALISRGKNGDEIRMAQLVQASEGFEQLERASIFLATFPKSSLRPAILLLLGDTAEVLALKLSNEANRRISSREMSASGAPIHSFYLNFVSLDRYRKLGINFRFNSALRRYYYNGRAWNEIITNYARTSEAEEARKRLISLEDKMALKS